MFTHGITADELPEYFDAGQEDMCRALQDVFRGYLARLVKENQLDFGSMLHYTRDAAGVEAAHRETGQDGLPICVCR